MKLSFQNSYKEWPATSVIFTVVLTQGQGQRLLTRMWCSTLALSKVKNSELERGWRSSRDVTGGWIQRGREKVRVILWRLQEEQHKSHSWRYRNSSGWAAREDAIHNLASANAVQRPEVLAGVHDAYQKRAWKTSEHNCGTPAGHQ